MRIIVLLASCFLGVPFSIASEATLGTAELGELQRVGGKAVFVPDTKRNEERIQSDPHGEFRGWAMIDPKLQATKPHRPNEQIITGGLGNFNIGLLAPCSGIPIFIAEGDQRPRLIGITDANGHFAVKLPHDANRSEVYLFFTGEVEALDIPYSDNEKRLSLIGGKPLESHQELVLKVGSTTERFRVSLTPKAEKEDP